MRISVVWPMLRYIANSPINNKPLVDTKYDFSIIVEKWKIELAEPCTDPVHGPQSPVRHPHFILVGYEGKFPE